MRDSQRHLVTAGPDSTVCEGHALQTTQRKMRLVDRAQLGTSAQMALPTRLAARLAPTTQRQVSPNARHAHLATTVLRTQPTTRARLAQQAITAHWAQKHRRTTRVMLASIITTRARGVYRIVFHVSPECTVEHRA